MAVVHSMCIRQWHEVAGDGCLADSVDAIQALLESLKSQVVLVGSATRSDLSRPSKCPGWTCCDVLSHSMAVTLRFARFASGDTDRPELQQGDLVGRDPVGSLGAAVTAAQRAWTLTDRARVCHLSFGDFDAETAAGINLVDVLAHGWDISPLQGRWLECNDEHWQLGLVAARALIGSDRDLRHYGPELVVGPGSTTQERFLAYLGRGNH
jgi:uncharacterized protein (TIGR03086 family)